MITLISFAIVVFGAINWLSIGMLQFDLIAGIFGSQASIFSRIIYICVGLAGIIITIIAINKKGKLTISKKLEKPAELMSEKNK